jgi:hypothetical protein
MAEDAAGARCDLRELGRELAVDLRPHPDAVAAGDVERRHPPRPVEIDAGHRQDLRSLPARQSHCDERRAAAGLGAQRLERRGQPLIEPRLRTGQRVQLVEQIHRTVLAGGVGREPVLEFAPEIARLGQAIAVAALFAGAFDVAQCQQTVVEVAEQLVRPPQDEPGGAVAAIFLEGAEGIHGRLRRAHRPQQRLAPAFLHEQVRQLDAAPRRFERIVGALEAGDAGAELVRRRLELAEIALRLP